MASVYDSKGAMRVTVVSGSTKTGLYAVDGSINVYDATGAVVSNSNTTADPAASVDPT